MPVLETKRPSNPPTTFGLAHNGIAMTPDEFDLADFDETYRYELANGILIVTPIPLNSELDPNEYLGHLLIQYQEYDSKGAALDRTLAEQTVRCKEQRRRADRVIWAGLKRRPRRFETPTIVVEFVSKRKRDRLRDYVIKRTEYDGIGVKEYWIIDRFERTMSVFRRGRVKPVVVREGEIYRTPLLPGFELPIGVLLSRADYWEGEEWDTDDEN